MHLISSRQKTFRFGLWLVNTSLFFFLLTGHPRPAGAENVKALSARCLKALGGEKRLKQQKSWELTGTATRRRDGQKGSCQIVAAAPDLFRLYIEINGGVSGNGFNGKSCWCCDPWGGLQTLTGDEASNLQDEARYHCQRLLFGKQDKNKLMLSGTKNINNKPAQTLILTTPRGASIQVCIDSASGLPLREEFPLGNVNKIFEYTNYRSSDGLMEPFTIAYFDGQDWFDIQVTSTRHNRPLERTAFDAQKTAAATTPDIDELLKQVATNQEALEKLMENYTYTATHSEQTLDDKGRPQEKESKVYEISHYHGHNIRRLVREKGRPLSPGEQAKEDRRLEKEIREIEKRENDLKTKAAKPDEAKNNGINIEISTGLKIFKFTNPRRERFRQRDVTVFDFEPNPSFQPKNQNEKLMQKLTGTIWIDAADRQVARFETHLLAPVKFLGGLLSVKPGGAIIFEQDRFNNEVWLPSRLEINFAVRALLVSGNYSLITRYSNFQRFKVEAEEKIKY